MKSPLRLFCQRLILLLLLLPAGKLLAHGLPPTRIQLQPEGSSMHMVLQVPWMGLARVIPALADTGPNVPLEQRRTVARAVLLYMRSHVTLARKGASCLADWRGTGSTPTHFLIEVNWDCPGKGPLTIRADPFFDETDTARVYLHLQRIDGSESTLPLFPGRPRVVLMPEPETRLTMAERFVGEGVRHILGGLDHLLFLLGLILISGTWRRLGWAVTGFTVGHTATLFVVATLGRGIATGLFGPLIALSILYIGYEAWFAGTGRGEKLLVALHLLIVIAALAGWVILPLAATVGLTLFVIGFGRWLAAGGGQGRFGTLVFPVLFGLLHGMGFAGPMLELQLRGLELLIVIFSFNLGVECGQFFLMGVALLFFFSAKRLWLPGEVARQRWILAGSVLLMVAGGIWFVARAVVWKL